MTQTHLLSLAVKQKKKKEKSEAEVQAEISGHSQTKRDLLDTLGPFIGEQLWPHCKFLLEPDLSNTEDGSICHVLAVKANVPKSKRKEWWLGNPSMKKSKQDTASRATQNRLQRKRSSSNQTMQKKVEREYTLNNWEKSQLPHMYFPLLVRYEQGQTIDMKQLLQLRDDRSGTFDHFVAFLVPCVANHRWQFTKTNNVMTKKTFQEATTKFDEAFAILLLENSIDVWKYDYEQKAKGEESMGTDSLPLLHNESVVYSSVTSPKGKSDSADDSQDEPTSKPKVKYSCEYSDDGKANYGWTDEGIKRYNELVALVDADRKKNGHWDVAFMEWVKKIDGAKMKKRAAQKAADSSPVIKPCMDLSSLFKSQGLDEALLTPSKK